jgi:hypothetical protein
LHREREYFKGVQNIAQGERILHRDRQYFTGIENIAQR